MTGYGYTPGPDPEVASYGPWFVDQMGCVQRQRLGEHGDHLGYQLLDGESPFAEMVEALQRLTFAAQCRDNTQGDPIRLLEVQAELRAAKKQARTALAKALGQEGGERPRPEVSGEDREREAQA